MLTAVSPSAFARWKSREALLLALERLGVDDPLVPALWRAWAAEAQAAGDYETAARCLLAVQDVSGALDVLARPNTVASLRAAALLAHHAGHPTAADRILRWGEACLVAGDVAAAHQAWATRPEHAPLALWAERIAEGHADTIGTVDRAALRLALEKLRVLLSAAATDANVRPWPRPLPARGARPSKIGHSFSVFLAGGGVAHPQAPVRDALQRSIDQLDATEFSHVHE